MSYSGGRRKKREMANQDKRKKANRTRKGEGKKPLSQGKDPPSPHQTSPNKNKKVAKSAREKNDPTPPHG